MRVGVYLRLAGHKLIRKIYDDSISDMMFVFCHHRSHTHTHNYQILCDSPLQFQFLSHILSYRLLLLFKSRLVCRFYPTNVMMIFKLINTISLSKLLCSSGVTKSLSWNIFKMEKIR